MKDAHKTYSIAALSVIPSGSHGEVAHGFESFHKTTGQSIRIVPFYSLGTDQESVHAAAREILDEDYDLIFCIGKLVSVTMYELTKDMKNPAPLIFTATGFPQEWGLIDSLASSKNHLVGVEVTPCVPDITKLVRLFSLYPETNKVLIPYVTPKATKAHGNLSSRGLFITPLAHALKDLGKEVITLNCPTAEEGYMFLEQNAHKADCIILVEGDPLLHLHGPLGGICRKGGTLLCANMRTGVRCSATFGYGLSLIDVGKKAGEYAYKILFEGVAPSDLPTAELAGQRQIMVNTEIARAQGADVKTLLKAAGKDAIVFERQAAFPPRYDESK